MDCPSVYANNRCGFCSHSSTAAEGSSRARNFVVVCGPMAPSSNSIGRSIKAVCERRRALHRPGERSMVETVSKRGYRIAADLNEASCPCSGFVRAEAGLATDAAAAYMTGRQAEGDGHIGTVTWVPPTSRLPARARIATRWLAHVAAECGAERTRRPVADAFRHCRKPEAFPAQQVLRDRHPPCEQVFHRWQADGTCEAFEERRTRQGGAQSTTSVAPVIAG